MIVLASLVVAMVFGPELKRGIAAQLFETRAARPPLNSTQRRDRELYWASRRGWQFGVPTNAYSEAVRVMQQERAASRQSNRAAKALLGGPLAASAFAPSLVWNFIGPQPITTRSNFTGEVFGSPFAATGRITSIAIDPKGGLVVVGAASGGVWLSTNDGTTFAPVFDSQPTLAVGAIALDPTTSPTTIYVATGEGNSSIDSLYGQGIFMSVDLGQNWTQLPQPGFDHYSFTSLAIDTSVHPVTIYAGVTDGLSGSRTDGGIFEADGSQDGLWKSIDGGSTWMHYDTAKNFGGCEIGGEPCPADDVVIDPSNPSNAYVAIDNGGVYWSHDAGTTWNLAPLPIFTIPVLEGRLGLAVGPPSGGFGILYAMVGAQDGAEYEGLFVSQDGGKSWNPPSLPSPTVPSFTQIGVTIDGTDPSNFAQSFYDMKLVVAPSDPTGATLFFGGVGLYRSTDNGHTWTFVPQNGGTHSDQHALQYDPATKQMFVGNDGGLYSFDPTIDPSMAPVTFASYNSMINASLVQGIGVHPTDAAKVFAGFQGIGTQLFSGSVATWKGQDSENGDGGVALWDPNDPSNLYATFSSNSLANPSISVSTDGGTTWCSAPLPAPSVCASAVDMWSTNLQDQLNAAADPGPTFYPPIAVDPTTAHRVFFGAHQVYVSDDGMRTWLQQTDQDLTDINCPDTSCSIEDLEFAPSDHTKAWAVAMADLVGVANFAVSNTSRADQDVTSFPPHGADWTDRTLNLPFNVGTTQATSIAVDPLDSDVAYLALSGFTADTGAGHLYQTQDFGATWTRADGAGGVSPLPDVPVVKVLVDSTDRSGTCSGGKACSNSIYVGTDIGVFHSADGGQTWQADNTNSLPTVPVYDLQQNQNGVMFAGTHGRGVFELIAPTPTPTATPTPTPTPTATPTPAGVALSVKPASLKFPNEVVGAQGASPGKVMSVTLTSPKGTSKSPGSPVTLSAIDVSGVDFILGSGSAKTSTTCTSGMVLLPGNRCSVPVNFQATNTGVRSGTLQIEHNGTNDPIIVKLRGKGVLGKLGFAPASLNFPKTSIGNQSTKQVTLTNSNSVSISITKISINGIDSGDFSDTTSCSKTLANKSECTIAVTFAPSTTGKRTATLQVNAGALPNPISIKLRGSGG